MILTLAAGLASTVFAPLSVALADRFDWRTTYLVLAAVLAVITIPGKSTTARIAVRLEQADAGTISFDGHDITKVKGSDLRELRRKIQLVYQNPYASLDPKLSVQDIVAEPLRAFKVGGRSQQQSRAAELLDQVALPEQFLSRKPDYPIEQYIRDAKIDTLYEGTTAIQAQDFFFRKIARDRGVALAHVAGLRSRVGVMRLLRTFPCPGLPWAR